MRRTALAALLIAALPAVAQQPAPIPGPIPAPPGAPQVNPNALPLVALNPNDPLDRHLMAWEQKMQGVQAFHVEGLKRTETDPTTRVTEEWVGEAKFRRPGQAYLFQQKKGAQVWQMYIFTGTELYEYKPQQKVVQIYQLQLGKNGQPQLGDDNFRAFLFGMKAIDAKTRYTLKLAGEDATYVYIEIWPNDAADKAEFTKARLALWKASYMPAQLTFVSPNNQGQQIQWDLPKVNTTPAFAATDFAPRQVGKEWTTQRTNPQAVVPPPNKVRPAGS